MFSLTQADKSLEALDREPQVGDLLFQTHPMLPTSVRERIILILTVEPRKHYVENEAKKYDEKQIWLVMFYDFSRGIKLKMNMEDRSTYYLIGEVE